MTAHRWFGVAVFAAALDTTTTWLALASHRGEEMNPVLRSVIESAGLGTAMGLRMVVGLVAFGALAACIAQTRSALLRTCARPALIGAALVTLAVALNNVEVIA